MPANKIKRDTLEEGLYPVSDPAILNRMFLFRDAVTEDAEGSEKVVVPYGRLITPSVVETLLAHDIKTVHLFPVMQTTSLACVEHMEKTFSLLSELLVVDDEEKDLETTDVVRRKKLIWGLEKLIRDNMSQIGGFFTASAINNLTALTDHHDGTVRKDLVSALQLMDMGCLLKWSDAKILMAAMGLINRDIGNTHIKQETLDYPGRFNNAQREEIETHPLLGCRMLHQPGEPPDFFMLTSLLHHEWYAEVKGKGYGGLTTHYDIVKRSMKFDCRAVVGNLPKDIKDVFQITGLLDMAAALEENQPHRQKMEPFKVLIIMNTDARLGHFNPDQYRAWYRTYLDRNPQLLPQGLRIALPREKERRIFQPLPPVKIRSKPLLTYYELEKTGLLSLMANVGIDVERIRRRGGLALNVLKQIAQERKLAVDLSTAFFDKYHITLTKTEIIPEEHILEFDGRREWLTVKELNRSGLMDRTRFIKMDNQQIIQHGGIHPGRLTRRGIKISEALLKKLKISLVKQMPIQLPGSENILTLADCDKMAIPHEQLSESGCYFRLKTLKNGVPLNWLLSNGVPITEAMMTKAGVDPVRKIFYDIIVTEEISSTRAKFMIVREGDDPKELDILNEKGKLDPLQDLLINQIGDVEMDFSEQLSLPDFGHVMEGQHWHGR